MLNRAVGPYFRDQQDIKNVKLLQPKGVRNPTSAILHTFTPLRFIDGATLQCDEEIEIVNGSIQRPAYSYSYEAHDDYFRYERDYNASVVIDSNGNPIPRLDHPECHLHVNQQEPRYMTHATSFEEVFRFIMACFYSS